ncbi:MAG: transcriptional regulator [Cyanobacteria bacterium]|nr:transcriptional regulator [Cyanobacteriota bacterium]
MTLYIYRFNTQDLTVFTRTTYNTAWFFGSHPVFTGAEFNAFFPERNRRAKQSLLDYHVKTGTILRIKRGLFATVPMHADSTTYKVNPLLIAAKAVDDSVIAYHSALTYHGLSQSIRHVLTFQSRHKDTAFSFQGNDYRPVYPKRSLVKNNNEAIFSASEELQGLTISVTIPERTMVDCLDRIDLTGGIEEVWRSLEGLSYVNASKVLEYVALLDNALLSAKVGYFLETRKEDLSISEETLTKLEQNRPKFPTYMLRSKQEGELVHRWNLIVPKALKEQSWEEQF